MQTNTLESTIQSKLISSLEKAGWIVLRSITNSKAGFPDIQALKNKNVVFIEVKRPGGRVTEIQKFRHDQLKVQGFDVIVATGKEDIAHLI